MKKDPTTLDRLQFNIQVNRALANDLRQSILVCVLAQGDQGIRTMEIAANLDEPQASVSKGLRALEQSSLVSNIVAKDNDGISSRYFPTQLARDLFSVLYKSNSPAHVLNSIVG